MVEKEDDYFLNVHEILDLIDERYNYKFKGKDKNDHLIGREAWHGYVTAFFLKLAEDGQDEFEQYDKQRGGTKNRTYNIKFVEEIIEFRSEQLKKQYNSNRKTMVDDDWINLNKALMGWSDEEVPKSVYNKRVIITEYKLRENNRYPEITEEDKAKVKGFLIDAIINDLIDEKKLEADIEEWAKNGELIYGYADPLEMIEDDEPIGFKVDRKKYLKDKVVNEIKNS